jgi:tetratricopeptide (TPR) repeat protein
LIDRCLALNPRFARGWHWSALLRLFAGHLHLTLEHLEIYLRLSPSDRTTTYLSAIGEAHFFSRRFDEAAANLLASLETNPGFPVTYRVLAASFAHMGRLDEARDTVRRLRAFTSVVMESAMRYRNPEHRELLLSGLRLAAAGTNYLDCRRAFWAIVAFLLPAPPASGKLEGKRRARENHHRAKRCLEGCWGRRGKGSQSGRNSLSLREPVR